MNLALYISLILAAGAAFIAAPHPHRHYRTQAAKSPCSAGASTSGDTAFRNAKAVCPLSNDATANSVVAVLVANDGTLSDGSITPTGGKGASGIDGKTNNTASPDALFSQ